MKPEELRLNNLVTLTEEARKSLFDCDEVSFTENIHNVAMIDRLFINLNIDHMEVEFNISDIEYIPLTEEWLKKCEFEKINHIGGYSFWSLKRPRKSSKPSICIYSSYTTVGNNTHVNHCKYVHQLQNLYFALTGMELTIKE